MVVIGPADGKKQHLLRQPPAAAIVEKPAADRPLIRRRGLSVPASLDIAPAAEARPGREGGYTSLHDVIAWPAAAGVSSPATTPGAGSGCGEIRIKNRLVQQAAHAYLLPTPTARGNRRRGLLFSCGELLSRFFQFIGRVCRSVCRSLRPYGWRNVYIIQIKY